MLNETIYEDGNGGQLEISNNDIMTTESLSTLAYLLMFGGNIQASTQPASESKELRFDWWGNNDTEASATWINSETERTLKGIALNSSTLETIKQAVVKDVRELDQYGEVEVLVQIVTVNKVQISVTITEPSTQNSERLALIWDATKNEVIEKRTI